MTVELDLIVLEEYNVKWGQGQSPQLTFFVQITNSYFTCHEESLVSPNKKFFHFIKFFSFWRKC